MRYVLPTAPKLCSYTTLMKMNCQMSICSTNDIGFISTKLFSFSNPILKFVAEIHQKKMLKMHAAVWHYF